MKKPEERERGALVESGREPQTFEEVYEAYGERVLNLAFRFTGNEETARDLTQEIFIKVYRNLESFEGRSRIYTWIHRIALNHITNHLKRERRHRWLDLLDSTVGDLLRENRIDPSFGDRVNELPADRKLERSERERIVRQAIETLPVKYRVPLVLHHYEEMSYKEVAAALGLSMSAVESRIHRAKKRLIRMLEPLLGNI